MRPIKSLLAGFLTATAAMILATPTAQAALLNIEYSGTIASILNPDGSVGGSFSAPGGVAIGDTFSGTFTVDTVNATPSGTPPPGGSEFDFGAVFPTLTLNSTQGVGLKTRTGLTVVNDAAIGGLPGFFLGGIRETGFDPAPNLVDAMVLFTDEVGFDGINSTGFEIILFSFDPTASVLSDSLIRDPFTLLDNVFFLFYEQINGVDQAAGFGVVSDVTISSVPEPTTVTMFGIGAMGLAMTRVRRKRAHPGLSARAACSGIKAQ